MLTAPLRRIVPLLVSAPLLVGCAGTTIADGTTTVPAATTTPTVPAGGLDVILPLLLDTLAGLSQDIVDQGGAPEEARLAQARAIYEVAGPLIDESHPELTEGFERMMALAVTAVERRRPADADKAYAFMAPLVDAALAPPSA